METRFNYRMLELARCSRGLNQKEVAEAIGRTQALVSNWEHNLRVPNLDDVQALGQLLDYPLDFFSQDELDAYLPPVQGHYRKKAALKKASREKLESHFRLLGGWLSKLQDAIEPEDGIGFASFAEDDEVDKATPEAAARSLRRKWKLGNGPIRSLTHVLESHKIAVLRTWLVNDHIDGYSFFTMQGLPAIYVNRERPVDRMRFNLAHELGHLVMHSDVLPDPAREKEAHRFASEFLMPSFSIDEQLDNLSFERLPSLKAYWGASMAAVILKAFHSERISESKYKSMLIELGHYQKNEPVDLSKHGFIEEPTMLKEMIRCHVEELDMTLPQIRDMLKIGVRDFSSLLASIGYTTSPMFVNR